MALKNYYGDTLSKKEKAEEDLYFAQRDRELIEALRRRRQKNQEASGSGAVEDASADIPDDDSQE